MIASIESKIITYEPTIQSLCCLPFYGHPHGCPNFGRKQGCPPNQPLIDKVFNLEREIYVIYTQFNVGEFAERMRVMHPEWENQPRQLYNLRRWQPKARKEHRYELEIFMNEHPNSMFNTMPEAHGVNLSQLMRQLGIELKWDWPPKHSKNNEVYLISLGGTEFKN